MNTQSKTTAPPELLYACPFCSRSGFTHRGLSAHWCQSAPERAGEAKRKPTKNEIARIVFHCTDKPEL